MKATKIRLLSSLTHCPSLSADGTKRRPRGMLGPTTINQTISSTDVRWDRSGIINSQYIAQCPVVFSPSPDE